MKWIDLMFIWGVRILAVYLTIEWYEYTTKSDFTAAERYSFRNMVICIPQVIVVFTLGLWLSTTEWGSRARLKWLTAFLLIPSVIASPMILGSPNSAAPWVMVLISVACYIRIFKGDRYVVAS